MTDRFDAAIAAIDAANADDPNRIVVGGVERPKELAHAELVTEWVAEPDDLQLLAARAHHLRRWTVPRSSQPMDRKGYLRWRKGLHEQHARDVAVILGDVGYDETTVGRVQDLVRKRGLGSDREMQVLEDAMCLVFLETQLTDFAVRKDEAKVVDVLRKTAKKMSPEALALAGSLDLDEGGRTLLAKALG